MVVVHACSKDDDDFRCEPMDLEEETIQILICCNSKECYLEWNEVKYWCDGTDCQEAAERMVNDILGLQKDAEVCKDQLIQKLLYR